MRQIDELLKTTIKDCFTLPGDDFLRKAHVDLGFEDQLIALCLWYHQDTALGEIEKRAEESQVPFKAVLAALGRMLEARLWTVHPIRLTAALYGTWVDDSALQHIAEIVDRVKRGGCACGNCEPESSEMIH